MTSSVDLAGLSGLDLLRTAMTMPDRPPFIGDLLGMEVDEIEHGRVVFAVRTRQDFANPLGTTHGGICATLLDSVMGCAVHTTLEAGVGYTTLELKINYIRAAPTDGRRLTATGTTIHVGRTTATAEGRVVDEDGRLVAHGTTTCVIFR
ncbi:MULTISPECIES: PaaI family thioesterase [Nocardia]|nr:MULTISPECIES: PaaI family thioesterase [Nocardia]MBA4856603.1 PaaI family thioesterase [Nocardia farcinica]MBC9816606.1 PaaI family thioesterase [Nocardia farcinica]MBF6069269.1 PaaI family thioesterase [Nocardia farcinica]MBF6143369.1 PaaI family thioesterase [Nocardia farcinica]MBF6187667.1 PaaI family thioesterase [Nocardia farcinica]